ncbi:hypothetical protein [Actinokineospora sp.]|uniref:hypothetical protein n=1 Tax=Actinokineospora sp. TaxID=1872133 RepID=UPI003D6A337D
MTATMVDRVEVLADEPTEAAMRDRAGKPVVWQQTRTLLLADGRTVYGCAHCDYTSDNVRSIRPHLNKHRGAVEPEHADLGALGEVTLAEALARLADHDQVAADRDEWKTRATRAERSLAALRRALKGVAT